LPNVAEQIGKFGSMKFWENFKIMKLWDMKLWDIEMSISIQMYHAPRQWVAVALS
jgi:hypothetical protein